MALSLFDQNILNFLYELTKLEGFMSCDQISRQIKLERKEKISPKTVERWFSFLKKKYQIAGSRTKEKFNYYPTFFFEKLGLVPIYVISEKPDLKILNMLPFQDYVAWLFDPKINKSVLLTGYLVPIEHLKKFKSKWKKLKQKNLVKDYKIYVTHKGFDIYSPWHKVIDKNGTFHPEKNVKEEIDRQLKEFKSYLDNLPKTEMIPEVKKNPLIIPVLFEYYYQYWSSPQVWKVLKRKLGSKAWHYIKKKKRQTDALGIKRVQHTIRDIDRFNLIHQMHVTYMPVQIDDNFFIYFTIEKNNSNFCLKFLRNIALNSIYIKVYPIDKKKFFIISLTNQKILEILDKDNIKEIYFLQHKKSLNLLTTQKYKKHDYYKHFNPLTKKWEI